MSVSAQIQHLYWNTTFLYYAPKPFSPSKRYDYDYYYYFTDNYSIQCWCVVFYHVLRYTVLLFKNDNNVYSNVRIVLLALLWGSLTYYVASSVNTALNVKCNQSSLKNFRGIYFTLQEKYDLVLRTIIIYAIIAICQKELGIVAYPFRNVWLFKIQWLIKFSS